MRGRRLIRGIVTIGVSYVLVLAFWMTAWRTLGDAIWLLIALNRYALYLLFPALFLPGLWAIDRRWVLLPLVPIAIFLGLYGPSLFPMMPVSSGSVRLRVLSFNVLYSNPDTAQVSDLIRRASPDLVALQ